MIVARNLLRLHREVYSQFWKWSDNIVDLTILTGQQATVFGWVHRITEGYNVNKHNPRGDGPNPRTLRNFYMQANGAEILRLACILATAAGIRVCAPIHDAVLTTAPVREIEEAAAAMSGYMREASRIVLNGFELRTDLSVVRYPGTLCFRKRCSVLEDCQQAAGGSDMSAYEKQLTWDREGGKFVPVEPGQLVRHLRAIGETKPTYGPSLEIASHTRNALLAVIAIIRNRNNGQPFVFGNETVKALGFRSEDKTRALKQLEAASFVEVEWRNRKSPVVTVLKGF